MGFTEYGTVIVGYQGVGKSTLSFHNSRVIDLESSNFFVDGKRSDDWYIPYCNIARALCRQGFIVCVSSHKVVRDELCNKPAMNQVIVYPSLSLKDKWINMLRYRWESSSTDKNYKAYQNYQGFAPVGGGCFSGKEGTKVDRSGAYKARQIAIRYLNAHSEANWVQVQLSYAIGIAEPMAIYITSDKGVITDVPKSLYAECAPARIIKDLHLKDGSFKYSDTAKFGHFGISRFPWEE